MKSHGGSAFPVSPSEYQYAESGLTKREYFAALAMQALVSGTPDGYSTSSDASIEFLAKRSFDIADAMVACMMHES